MDGKGTEQLQRPGAPRRPSPAVYRRRRLVAGVLAVLVLVGLILAVTSVVRALSPDDPSVPATVPGPTQGPAGSVPAGTPAAAAPAQATPSATPGEASPAGSACPADKVSVSASTDAVVYPAGSTPLLTMTVTNTSDTACEINVGTTQMEFIVASGSDRIFSSMDCQDGAQDYVKKVEPGASETANFPWERNRSAPGCAAVASNPNPGYYIFTARLGQTSSENAVFQLE